MGSNCKAAIAFAFCLVPSLAVAQQSAPQSALDVIPEKMPFNIPYGPPITLDQAHAVIQTAVEEAKKRGWEMNVAVTGPSGDLIAFARMDGAALASISIAQHKARVAARYRRPTHVFEDNVQKNGYNYQLSLDDIIASRGGIPLVLDGKLVGAVGCSGGTGSQDEAVCTAAAGALPK